MHAKRALVAILWFVAGWELGAMVVFCFGLAPQLAAVSAVLLAAVVLVDPARVLWNAPRSGEPATVAGGEASV